MGNKEEGSIFSGRNPFAFNIAAPLSLFIIQLILIISTCKVIKFILKPLKQPNVIAEIIGGIVLGPTLMGRIPNYLDTIFNSDSLPFLNLVSNFGLVLFLFMVGLELDLSLLKTGLKRSLAISLSGMTLAFSVCIGVSTILYNSETLEDKPSFITYFLFIGVSMSITAFPVLARILNELDLLKTSVGTITISAAAIDDVTSWCILALVVILVNAGSGIVALYIFLIGLGYVIFCLVAIRPLFKKFLEYEKSYLKKSSQLVVCITFMLVFGSAFITDTIGIHPIFGGFIVGIITPRENRFAHKLINKIEDLVSILFLPLYFALSGLKTQIAAISSFSDVGLVFLVISCTFFSKITGCTLAAYLTKLPFRRALGVGTLMNCKGLVELIVLNIGYDAGVISQKTFTIMVIMALVNTFIVTPMLSIIYPISMRIEDEVHNSANDTSLTTGTQAIINSDKTGVETEVAKSEV